MSRQRLPGWAGANCGGREGTGRHPGGWWLIRPAVGVDPTSGTDRRVLTRFEMRARHTGCMLSPGALDDLDGKE
jgi:hypothetical protein